MNARIAFIVCSFSFGAHFLGQEMTLCYSYEVSTSGFGTFVKQLFRWRGSIYRLLYKEMIIYLFIYFAISITYRLLLNPTQRTTFEQLCLFCGRYEDFVPITMVLGFYVSWVVSRWWGWYLAIGYPDRISILVSTLVRGDDERGRIIRRTLVRYLNLANILVLRRVSLVAKKRFPEMHHVREAGFITDDEIDLYHKLTPWTQQQVGKKTREYDTFWVPLEWFCTLCSKSRSEGRIESDPALALLVEEVSTFRDTLFNQITYDWISVPLVYTQVCTLAVYTFFFTCLFSRQYLDPSKGYSERNIDLYIPIFTILEFLFYAGWLKVAESLMTPMGEQTDHFEINYILDRNAILAYLLADTFFNNAPTLQKDQFWDSSPEIPHTLASVGLMDNAYVGSAETYEVPADLYHQAPPDEDNEPDSDLIEPDSGRKMSMAYLQNTGLRQGRRFLSMFGVLPRERSNTFERDPDTVSTGSEKIENKTNVQVPIRRAVRFKDSPDMDTIYEREPSKISESSSRISESTGDIQGDLKF